MIYLGVGDGNMSELEAESLLHSCLEAGLKMKFLPDMTATRGQPFAINKKKEHLPGSKK